MLAANSTKPVDFAPEIVKITQASPGATTVYTFALGKKALAAGKKIRYVGAGGAVAFDRWHNSAGAFEAAHSADNKVTIVGTVSAAQIAALNK
jgi:hypothetical protein